MRLKMLFLAAATMLAGAIQAQMMPELPVDENVRIGKLDNGLTYYLRHNDNPEHKANFYIAQRVGSIQENDDQRGLAHFLEHMAFNGSEHFPTGSLTEYLQSIGVEYGRSLNAYTSIDRTVYYIADVSTERQSALDSCLLVLKDWSSGIQMSKEEIEKERDVIHNEYRLRTTSTARMQERALPELFSGSKYGYRMPIGLMSVVDGCDPATLQAYYKKWYRPDNQGIIIVGDIDVDHTEALIKKLFEGVKVPADAAQVEDVPVPDNTEAIYISEKDKEQQYPIMLVAMKQDAMPLEIKKTAAYLVTDYMNDVVTSMFNSRFSELSQQADCPYMQAMASYSHFLGMSKTKDALQLIGVAKEGQELETLKSIIREAKRARDFGFTATEYARAKADYLSLLEKQYTNRSKIKNEEFANQYVENYLDGDPIPSIETVYQMANAIAPNLPIELINEYVKELVCASDTNLVAFNMAQEKDGKQYVTPAQMKSAVDGVRAERLTAWVDNVKEEPLITELPKKGSIVKETENKQLGYKELKLSNGATVVMKKTDFKDDEVLIQGEAKGGMSLFPNDKPVNVQVFDPIIMYSGLGNFSFTELDKALAGKVASVSTSLSEDRQYISGRSTPKDMETLFQLLYLKMTNIKKDPQSVATFVNQMQMVLGNKELNNELVYQDSVESTLHKGSKLYRLPEKEDIEAFDYDRVLEIAKQLYGNGGQFIFTLIGNFDEAQAKEYICQYIASLPTGKAQKGKEMRNFFKGNVSNTFTKKMETPQAQTTEVWLNDKLPYTLENRVMLNVASQILTRIYDRTIREVESAAYTVSARGKIDNNGDKPVLTLTAAAPTNPDKQQIARDLLLKYAADAAKKITDEDLNTVREILLKQADDNARDNNHWMDVLTEYTAEGVDIQTNYVNVVKGLTTQKIQKFIGSIINSGNHAEIIMKPEQ